MNKTISFAVFGAMLSIGAAQGQSLGDRLAFQNAEKLISERAARIKNTCQVDIPASFDWSAVKGDDLKSRSANSYCAEAYSAIERVCGPAIGKEAVQKKIKRVTCGFGDKRAASLDDDGNLRFIIEWKAGNNTDFIYDMLMKAL